MDLRTKLVFTLVAAALLSMLALGALAYGNARSVIMERSIVSLSTLATAKAEQVEAIVASWEEAVGLVASRTQLRESLAAWNASGATSDRRRIERIVGDAASASRLVEGIAVYGADGGAVAATGAVGEPDRTAGRAATGEPAEATSRGDETPRFLGYTAEHPPRVLYDAALTVDGQPAGRVVAALSTDDLARVARGLTGLGETGETLIGTRVDSGSERLLAPRRLAAEATAEATAELPAVTRTLIGAALDGERGPITDELTDFRGEAMWAALRRVDAADIGLVVKFDAAEETADIGVLRERLLGVGFSLAAFAILLGVVLGFQYARPINALGLVATRLRDGDLSARANIDREDEIGLLAETFNSMGEELERRMELLQGYKTFFDEARDMLCIAGTDGYFKLVNPAFEEVLGWSQAELLGRPFVEFVHPDDVEATIRETEQLAKGIPTVMFTNRYLCRDGTYTHLHWRAHPDPRTGQIYASARSGSDLLS